MVCEQRNHNVTLVSVTKDRPTKQKISSFRNCLSGAESLKAAADLLTTSFKTSREFAPGLPELIISGSDKHGVAGELRYSNRLKVLSGRVQGSLVSNWNPFFRSNNYGQLFVREFKA